MNYLKKYLSFIKIEHILFSLPLLFAGAYMAGRQWPSLRLACLMLLAGAGARTVALVLNRIIDLELDQKNPRTKDRQLARGQINLLEAWTIVILGLAVYLYSAWLISDFCLRLSWIPIAAFAAYPFLKRFTKWVHLFLGLVWSLVPLGGFFAVQPAWDGILPILVLSVFSVFWLAGFDIIYATLDEEFDRTHGLFSIPSCWGNKWAMRISGLFHFLAFLSLVALYSIWLAGPITVMLLIVIGILLLLEQKFSNYVDLAFFKMNVAIGFVVMFFVLAGIKGV